MMIYRRNHTDDGNIDDAADGDRKGTRLIGLVASVLMPWLWQLCRHPKTQVGYGNQFILLGQSCKERG